MMPDPNRTNDALDAGGDATVDREQAVVEAFVALAGSLVNGDDAVDMLTDLTAHCAGLLGVASAGLLLADARGMLHVLAASSEATRTLEAFQVQREQGPCLDCYRSGEPVNAPQLAGRIAEWPEFVDAARSVGVVSAHAVPMRLRDRVLGALGLFGEGEGELNDKDKRLAQALADVASIAVVQDLRSTEQDQINQQLQTALNSRVVIEQAKGVLAQLGDLTMDQAFAVLRRYARDHNQPLSALAGQIVAREISAHLLLEHSRARR